MAPTLAPKTLNLRQKKQAFRKMLMNRLRPGCNEAKVINRALMEAGIEISIENEEEAMTTIRVQDIDTEGSEVFRFSEGSESFRFRGAASQETLIRWIKATFLVEDNPEAEHFQNVKLIAELCTPEERSIILDKYRINDLVELKPETARALVRRTKERRGEAQ